MRGSALRPLFVTTGFVWAIANPGLAIAQNTGTDDMQTIIVTARRVEERLQDVPISMTVFSQDQISKRNIVVASDLATYTPSLSVNQRYGPEKASFGIRGFNQDQGTAPSVGVYFADVVGARANGGTTTGNSVGAGAFMDLQNVQVLKGPQGTLQGRNTTGGAILLVPNKPTSKLEGWVEGSLGDYDLKRIQAVLNVPLADTFRVRFAVDRNQREGYINNRSGIGPDDYNDTNYFAARFSVVADLTPNLENYIIASYSHSFSHGFASRQLICDPTVDNSNPANFAKVFTAGSSCSQIARQNARGDGYLDVDVGNPDPHVDLRQWQIINTTTWHATDTMTIKNIISYAQFTEDSRFNLASDNFTITAQPSFLPPYPPGIKYQYVQLDGAPGRHLASQSTFTEELQFQGNMMDGRLIWQLGGYLELARPLGFNTGRTGIFLDCVSPMNLQCTNPLGIGYIAQSATKYSYDNNGVYAQATYKFTNKISLTGGFRYTFDRIHGVNESTRYRFLPGAGGVAYTDCNDQLHFTNPDGTPLRVTNQSQCHFEMDNNSSKPTWMVDVDYKPTDDILVYAKYSRGYRQGGINFTNPGLETWQPEKVDAYEIGAKTSFNGFVRGTFNIAGFYNDFSNQQIFAALFGRGSFPGGAGIINAGKSRIQGVEVDASLSPLEGLRFDIGYTYLDTKLVSVTVPPLTPLQSQVYLAVVPTAQVGQPLTLSPKNRVTLSGSYALPLGPKVGRVTLGATYIHTDSSVANAGDPPSVGILPATDLLNLNVNWDKAFDGPFDLAFFATNVTNQIYAVSSGGQFGSTGTANGSGIGDILLGQPRMYGFRLRYSFGK
ncbi:MAG TPA: TonB-dependent receptor [Sphingobium sp.]|uniref:TonB-dependent receptor n=1 Tax=Sphingobium sp. TaxID=1912891 RepID=UPI002ED16BBA